MMLKYLFIAFLIIVFVPSVRRFLFWLLVGRQLVKEQKRQNEQFRPRRDGETYVQPRAADQKPGQGFKGGEYVDYEEVK
nr:DUF4834 domain-containing protein [uncultured Arsenicibacter sp.]